MTVSLVFLILNSSIKFRKKYRIYWNLLHRALSDYVTNIKYVKINGLESMIIKEIKNIRTKSREFFNRLAFLDILVDVLFFSPTVATSLVAIALQRTINGDFDIVATFAIVGALSTLRRPLMVVSESIEKYTEFGPSYSNLSEFLLNLPDTPKHQTRMIDSFTIGAEESNNNKNLFKVAYQFPNFFTEEDLIRRVSDDFAVWFEDCTFRDKSREMQIMFESMFQDVHQEIDAETRSGLHNLMLAHTSVVIPKRSRVCLVGSEHSGIKHFLLGMKQELELVDGEVLVNGKVVIYNKRMSEIIKDLSFVQNIISNLTNQMFEHNQQQILNA